VRDADFDRLLWRPFAENYFWETENPYHDAKLQHFMPYEELAGKTRRDKAGWFMPEEQVFPKHAKSIEIAGGAGGLAGIGSHGNSMASVIIGKCGRWDRVG